MGAAKAAPPPLMTLRDLLELACESSCSEGFRSYPRRLPWHGHDQEAQLRAKAAEVDAAPVRLLIEADLRRSPSRTLSSILFPRSPGSLAAVSRLTRSLSRRLVFWRRHREDAGERDSLGLPSPVVSSCSASECSEPAAETTDLPVPEEQASGASDQSQMPSTSIAGSAGAAAAAGDGHHKALDGDRPVGSSSVESMEDKQQLSPVSVMDFPFHDDDADERSDAGTCSPSFQQRQPDLERPSSAREPPPHRIRRLDGPAHAAVDPVDLEPRFVASDESGPSVSSDDTQHTMQSDSSSASTDHDSASATTTTSTPRSSDDDEQHRGDDDGERELDAHHRLFTQLLKDDGGGTAVATAVAAERLLLDFFAEGLDRCRSSDVGPVVATVKPSSNHIHDESALLRVAKEWVQGAGTQWGVEDVLYAGPAALADMDRERRWMRVGEEEREVGAEVEGLLLDALVAELVRDLLAAARC